jgi:hypothetical protein
MMEALTFRSQDLPVSRFYLTIVITYANSAPGRPTLCEAIGTGRPAGRQRMCRQDVVGPGRLGPVGPAQPLFPRLLVKPL